MKLPRPLDELRIVHYPDPVLRKKCKPVESFDNQLAALARRMEVLMREAGGLGLAAPQVGVPIRMFICNPTREEDAGVVWVNPVLSDLEGAIEAYEGCLSIPEVSVPKRRAVHAVIDGFDLTGKPMRAQGDELIVRIWQHEMDHVNGVLVIDHMSAAAELANRRIIRQLEADYAAARRRRKAPSKR
ncbi:MAG: peptide deformylase [Phycisphaerae bacterium]